MLAELIDRLEKATEPDGVLDDELARIAGWTFQKMTGDAKPYWREPGETAYYMRSKRPSFTASIDAALTLVPDGHGWVIDFMDPYEPEAMCGQGWCGRDHGDPDPKQPAIMLCIAALKARLAAKVN